MRSKEISGFSYVGGESFIHESVYVCDECGVMVPLPFMWDEHEKYTNRHLEWHKLNRPNYHTFAPKEPLDSGPDPNDICLVCGWREGFKLPHDYQFSWEFVRKNLLAR